MGTIKVSKELALQTLEKINDFFEVPKEDRFDDKKNIKQIQLLNMIQNGRLNFTEENKLVLNLYSSIKNKEGHEITDIIMTMLTGQCLIDASKNNKDELEQGLYYISISANIPLGSVFQMTTKDITNCQVVIKLFL
jgi:hypothetical protein